MKKKLLVLTAVLVVAVGVFAIPTVWLKPWSIDHFYARVFIRFALRHPMLLSEMRLLEPLGLDFHADDLDDVSLDFQRREAAWAEEQLAVLRSYDREALDEAGRLSYDVLAFYLDDLVREQPYLFHNYPVNQLSGGQAQGVQSRLPDFMINTHQINDLGDAEDYVARLARFGVYFDQVVAGLGYRRDAGIVPPRFVLEKSIAQMRELVAPAVRENLLYEHLDEKLGELAEADAKTRKALLDRAAQAIETVVYPAYRRLIETSEALEQIATTDDGAWKLPDGEAFYAQRLRHYTTTEMSADEIHALGLAQVAEIEAEMRQILTGEGLDTSDPGATLERLLDDPRFLHADSDAGREEILAEFTGIVEEIEGGLDGIFDVLPKAGVEVRRLPEFRQASAAQAYYDAPPFDGSKPGIFWVNLRNVSEHARFKMRTLAYHEAVPGHHFQIALARELKGVPFFRRIIPFAAFVEGWALYAERLAAEHGFQDDPFDRLGYLQAQLFRAVRLVVDTGIHDRRWTREQAIEYTAQHTGMARTDVVAEIERYIVDPGQACAYKVGQLEILELRERARRELGDRFDLRRFHSVVLTHGAVPLTLLEQLVDRWIAEVKAG